MYANIRGKIIDIINKRGIFFVVILVEFLRYIDFIYGWIYIYRWNIL